MNAKQPIEKSQADADRQNHFVWDLPVRVFHWALVAAIVAAFVTNKLGVTYFKYHVWSGYAVLVLVAFRIVWGIVGTYHARFHTFLRGPKTIWTYLRDLPRGRAQHYLGHNPLGALMVMTLLLAVLVQAVTGLFGNDEIFNVGPLYGYIDNELSLKLTSLHRQLFYWLLGAIGIHILAVIAHGVFKRERLIAAMFTGRKTAPASAADTAKVTASRTWLAAVIVVAFAGALTWIVMSAPVPVSDLGY